MRKIETVPNITVFYHDDPDGFCAAWAAWKVLGDKAVYQRTDYGKRRSEPIQGGEVVFLDFCPPAQELMNLSSICSTILVIDHHTSNERLVKGWEKGPSNIKFIWDISKAGCRLTWEYYHPGEPVPKLIDHAEDHDMWKFALPKTREIIGGLRIHLRSFEEIDLMSKNLPALASEGTTIRAYETILAENFAREAYVSKIGPSTGIKTPVIVVNGPPFLASQIAGQVAKKKSRPSIIGIYWDRADGSRVWSLRSSGEVSCLDLARSMGGGGHPKAAGFLENAKSSLKGGLDDTETAT